MPSFTGIPQILQVWFQATIIVIIFLLKDLKTSKK